jgi:hypothetical protein
MGSIQNEGGSKVEGLGFKVSMGQTTSSKGKGWEGVCVIEVKDSLVSI